MTHVLELNNNCSGVHKPYSTSMDQGTNSLTARRHAMDSRCRHPDLPSSSRNATQSLCNPTYPAASTPPTVNCNIASPGIASPLPNHSIPALRLSQSLLQLICPSTAAADADSNGVVVRLALFYATLQSISACDMHLPLELCALIGLLWPTCVSTISALMITSMYAT